MCDVSGTLATSARYGGIWLETVRRPLLTVNLLKVKDVLEVILVFGIVIAR